MKTKEFMTIDGIPVEINGEKNLLELIRKAGIELPTFCYHTELSIYGACRMCVIENERGGIEAACSTPPKAGASIRTNTARLRRHRKMILELLLSNHCRDCTTCNKNGKCRLQELARSFHIDTIRFPNTAVKPMVDDSSPCITIDHHKCILCGDCVRMCNEVQNVGAIDFVHRGSKMFVAPALNAPIASSPCVGCGQCAGVCPTGAITVKNEVDQVWKLLDDPQTKVTVQIAPAVRVALGKELDLKSGENVIGRIVAALRRMGFDEVYDTSAGADLTVLEETQELLERLENNNSHSNDFQSTHSQSNYSHDSDPQSNSQYPLFTSCCPAWISYCEKNHPELLSSLSSCRSPMQMLASIVKEQDRLAGVKSVHVAIMPCTAKKQEAGRDEFKTDGRPNVDYVLTTQEMIQMIKEAGLVFAELEPEAADLPYGVTGSGVIFGVSGGVTEAVLRRLAEDKSPAGLIPIAYQGVRGMEGVKETSISYKGRTLRIAIVSGLKNVSDLIARIKAGEQFDFVEVMACPGGCVSGGGQPFATAAEKECRGRKLYSADKLCSIKRSEDNPLMKLLYEGILKGKVHQLLHVRYSKDHPADPSASGHSAINPFI